MTPTASPSDDFMLDDSEASVPSLPQPPEFARYVSTATLAETKNQEAADAWFQHENAGLADQWYGLAKGELDRTVQEWVASGGTQPITDAATAIPQTEPPGASEGEPTTTADMAPPSGPGLPESTSTTTDAASGGASPVSSPGQDTPDVMRQFFDGLGGLVDKLRSGAGEVNQTLQDNSLTGHGDLPSLNPVDIGNAAGDMLMRAQGREPVAQPSIPVLTGAAHLAGDLATPPMGAGRAAGMAEGALANMGIPRIMGAAEDITTGAADALAAHPLVVKAAEQVGVEASKIAEFIQSPMMAKVLRSPGRYVDQPGREVQTAAYAVYKVAKDAKLINSGEELPQLAATLEPSVEQMWDAIPGFAGKVPAEGEAGASEVPKIEEALGGGTAEPAEPASSGAGGKAPPASGESLGDKFGDMWRAVNRGLVTMKMMNPLAHPFNLGSEILNQYANPAALTGIVGDFQKAEAAMKSPEVLAQVLEEAPRLNLEGARTAAGEMADHLTGLQGVPVVGGLVKLNQQFVFDTVARRLQLASYQGARRLGMDADAAAEYANAKFGGISKADQTPLMKWVADNAAFAGKWLQGTGVQLGSLIGKPGFGGFATDLTAAQKTQLANALRGDFTRGVGLMVGSHALINHAVSGQWPWQNEDGHWLDINTGHTDAQGKTIYVTDPFFRRIQDAMHVVGAIPGTPLATAMGTTDVAALANKAAPLAGVAAGLASGGNQYLAAENQLPGITGGPPVIAPGSTLPDALVQSAAYVANQIMPIGASVSARMATKSPEGIKLEKPQLQIAGPGGLGVKPGGEVAANLLTNLAGARESSGPKDIGTKEQYFQKQLEQTYGADLVKRFGDASVKLQTAPATVGAGTGVNKVDVPLTDADRPVYEAAYKDTLEKGVKASESTLATANPQQLKNMLNIIEGKAYEAAKAAVAKNMSGAPGGAGTEAARRVDVRTNGASAFWRSSTGQAPSSAAPLAAPSGGAAAFWKKAAA